MVSNGFIVRISAVKDQEEYELEIPLPVTRMKKTSECFLQWRDKEYGGAWGLNFLSEKDIRKFMKICVLSSEEKASLNGNSISTSQTKKSNSLQKSASDSSINHVGLNSFEKILDKTQLHRTGSEHEIKPSIRKPLVPKRPGSVNSASSHLNSPSPTITPPGFDETEYEFLAKIANANHEDSDLEIAVGESAKSSSNSYLSIPYCNDDNHSTNSESLDNARPPSAIAVNRAIMTTRKAAWLLVKNILIHAKKGKLELATNRKWKQYWVALKGAEMLFYNADEKTVTTDDLDEPVFELEIDSCIAQAVPEHTRLENVFSLSTKYGNAYYLQSTSQTEVDNWIHCVHTAAATALSRRKKQDDITSMLKQEIKVLCETLICDEKLKKMAVLQLKVEKEAQTRQSMTDQILSWSNCLELHHAEHYRLQCYLAAMEGVCNPNPQELLSRVSRKTKQTLSKLGNFSVTSFHSYVNARNGIPLGEKIRLKPKSKSSSLKTKISKSVKNNNETGASLKGSAPKSRTKSGSRKDSSDGDSNTSRSSKERKLLQGRVGDKLYIQLLENKSEDIPYEPNLKICHLIERVCFKEGLDSSDYFITLMMDDNNQYGLLNYTIPTDNSLLDSFQYSSIKLCPMFILNITLTNPADYEHGPYGLAIKESIENRIVVTYVEEGSEARQLGILIDDEIIEVNGKLLNPTHSNLQNVWDIFNTSLSVSMKLKSKRIDDPKKTLQTTDNMINFLVCPPPPKSVLPDLSDDLLNSLIVPAPTDFEDNIDDRMSSVSSKFNKKSNVLVEAKSKDIEEFLMQTEEVNMMTRQMTAASVKEPSSPAGNSIPGIKLQKAIIELVETEKTYVKNLKILLDRYLIPLQEEDFLSTDEADLLVGNVRQIYEFQLSFFEKIKAIVRNERRFDYLKEAKDFKNVLYLIGELFLECVDKFKLYSTFCSCHSRAVKLLELNTNKALKAFLLARNPKNQHTGTLESYLITPIQRILRYPLLMKSMMKIMEADSEEYSCMKNALNSVEQVANYINEMQRINETYTPIFQEMCEGFIDVEKTEVGVDNLLHYGRVQWLNHLSDQIGKAFNNNITIGAPDAENLTIFIFKRVIILISDDPKLRQKMCLSISFNHVTTADIKFHCMIPVPHLILRDHAWSESDSDQVWEIVDTSSGSAEVTYMFANRTAEEKKVFVNAIKEVKKINKLENAQLVHSSNKCSPKPRKKLNSTSSNGSYSSSKNDSMREKILNRTNSGGKKKPPVPSPKPPVPSPKPFNKSPKAFIKSTY